MRIRRLGVLLRLHRRHKYISRIFKNIRSLAARRECVVQVSLDRPSPEVVGELNRQIRRQSSVFQLNVSEVRPLLSGTGQGWQAGLQLMYDELLGVVRPQVCMVWDDDWVLPDEAIRELKGHLKNLQYDRLEALSLFLWDRVDQFNGGLLNHWAPALFRVYPNDAFPQHFVVHCPERVARSRRVHRLEWPQLNYGWLTKQDRAEAWVRSRAAGRIDSFTMELVNPHPPLMPYRNQSVRDLHAPTR